MSRLTFSQASPVGVQPATIMATILDYFLSQSSSRFTAETLPRDQSLVELGVLDSVGVIEFIVFAETTWDIEISVEDITRERLGSLEKMADLVHEYAMRRPDALRFSPMGVESRS
jgi:acyl carrier protein